MNVALYAAPWAVFYRRQLADLQILLATSGSEQDETLVALLRARGFMAQCVSPTEAQALSEAGECDLLLSDKRPVSVPGAWFLRTDTFVESKITNAIAKDALDYALSSTPASLVAKRVEVALDAISSRRLFESMKNDLQKLIFGSGLLACDLLVPYQQFLVNLRVATPATAAFSVMHHDSKRGALIANSLVRAGCPAIVQSPKKAGVGDDAEVCIVPLDQPEALSCIAKLRHHAPNLSILAWLPEWDREQVDLAIDSGASDFILDGNQAASIQRTRLHIQLARREHFTFAALSELSRLVSAVCPDYDEGLLFAKSENAS